MTLFSLLSKEEEIRLKPGEKVIPEEDFTIILEASDVLKKVTEDLEIYKYKVEEECKLLKEAAQKEGFQEGLEKLNLHILKLDETIKKIESEYKDKILTLALKAAKKIVSEELKLHPEVIVDIVKQALKPVSQHHKIKIYVNKSDLDILENEKPKIKEILQQASSFSMIERSDIEPGGCIIETEGGIINAQLENQWRAIESAFESFMKK